VRPFFCGVEARSAAKSAQRVDRLKGGPQDEQNE
jgi:hypothetical protein